MILMVIEIYEKSVVLKNEIPKFLAKLFTRNIHRLERWNKQ
jgi:hypothetical protein